MPFLCYLDQSMSRMFNQDLRKLCQLVKNVVPLKEEAGFRNDLFYTLASWESLEGFSTPATQCASIYTTIKFMYGHCHF